MRSIPTQGELLLPFLETLSELGGHAKSAAVIEALSDRLAIPAEVRNDFREVEFDKWGTRRRCPWRQKIHWVRQNSVCRGLLEKRESGYWTLSEKGRGSLVKCQPGVIVTVYETQDGQVLWADAVTAAGAMADQSVNLIFTSPPYPLAGAGRKYGNLTPAETVELIVKCAGDWRRSLTEDGSLVLNFRDVWLPKAETGGAVRSLYQEKLLIALVEDAKLYLADKFWWRNPVVSGDAWATVRRVRTTLNAENVFWLSRSPNPKADNRRILVPASASTIATYRRKGARGHSTVVGPSGQKSVFEEQIAAVMAGEELKVIPRNVLDFANSDSKRALHAKLDQLGLPHHDATMPPKLAEFFIKFLTDVGDHVWDPFHGSGVSSAVCRAHGRRFTGSDYCLAHVLGSAVRFDPSSLDYGPDFSAGSEIGTPNLSLSSLL